MSGKESNQDHQVRDFMVGAVLGAVVGATVALLFAPKSGREMRQDIRNQAENLLKRGQEFSEFTFGQSNSFAGISRNSEELNASASQELLTKIRALNEIEKVEGKVYEEDPSSNEA